MKRVISLAASMLLVAGIAAGATAGPSAGGYSSDNVEFVQFVPFEVGTATGARVIGKYLYVTSWKSFSIYDVSDPANPQRLSTTPFGFKFENEDVATNGEILIFSEELPGSAVHVWDVEDKSNPVQIAELQGAGQHTMSCLHNCKWLYGSDGNIVDLRDPTKPKLIDRKWGEGMPTNGGHDVIEIRRGLVMTSSNPIMILNTKNPADPKLVAVGDMQEFVHSAQWPRAGKDKYALTSGETWVAGADAKCDDTSAGIATWDTIGYQRTHTLRQVDIWRPKNGTYADGSPVINAPFGCSSHWFQQHPKWKNGGLIAAGFYNHGTRFLDVAPNGKIKEVGYFVPHGGGTSGAYWMTDRIVYAIDYQRGFDVLKYNGKF